MEAAASASFDHAAPAFAPLFNRVACRNGEILWSWVLLDNLPDLALVCSLVLFEQVESVGLCWRLGVGLVEQRLNTQQNFFDVYCGLPTFFFVEDGKADGARGIDVRVEERRHEFAYCYNVLAARVPSNVFEICC